MSRTAHKTKLQRREDRKRSVAELRMAKAVMTDTPGPCPFCLAGAAPYGSHGVLAAPNRVWCSKCSTYGPLAYTPAEAVKLWNKARR